MRTCGMATRELAEHDAWRSDDAASANVNGHRYAEQGSGETHCVHYFYQRWLGLPLVLALLTQR
jgi:hypothetical protein